MPLIEVTMKLRFLAVAGNSAEVTELLLGT